MIHLQITLSGETTEKTFRGRSVRIGRSRQNDLALPDVTFLSRHHCRIDLVKGHCEVRDLSSTNGVQVNGIYMRRGVLEVGDIITISELTLELLEFGPEVGEPEEIRPCLECGFLIPIDDLACPRCSGSVMIASRRRIPRDHIPGYELKRKIGSGGMGIVFEAIRRSDRRTTAIKILKPHLAGDPRYLVRFVEETRVLTVLDHPNIVKIYGRGSGDGIAYIDMELVEGDSVRGLFAKEGPLEEARALRMIWSIVLALDFAAKKKIIHGDVKPSNFLCDSRSGTVKLCDFGLAELMDLGTYPGAIAHESGSKKGTAAYAAPERFERSAVPTVVSDIYSIGASLFQMLTGELPFGIKRLRRSSSVDPRREPPDPHELAPHLRPATCMLIQRMLAFSPQERYPDYRRLQDDLSLLL